MLGTLQNFTYYRVSALKKTSGLTTEEKKTYYFQLSLLSALESNYIFVLHYITMLDYERKVAV